MAVLPSLTLMLVGRTGNGKSATGNSILGRKAFKSMKSSSCITKSSELQTCVRKDGQLINVIDTPGMFDLSAGVEHTAREIMKCMNLASGGIHAILLVFSLRTRFSQEEEATIQTLQNSFGYKIVDYAIIVLTGGDEFEDEDDNALEDFLSHEYPVALKDILAACKNRCVLFDNKTRNRLKNDEQVNELLGLVNEVIEQNGGQPYMPDSFSHVKLEEELNEVKTKLELEQPYTHALFSDPKLEEKLNEESSKLEQQLVEERKASLQAKKRAQQLQKQSEDEIRNLKGQLENALQRPMVVKVKQDPHNRCCLL